MLFDAGGDLSYPFYSIINMKRAKELMPIKIRKLKNMLSKAGFVWRPGKGSHTVWTHPALPEEEITLAGKDGDDAKLYQIKDVQKLLRRLERE